MCPPGPDAGPRRDRFWGRPTLVAIEPASRTAVLGRNAADRKADTWAGQLASFERLEFAVSDAAKGIAKAVAQVAEARRDDPSATPLEHGLDLFHTTMEAHRVPARHWRGAEAVWGRAEAADAKLAAAKRQGVDPRGVAQAARAAWGRATASFGQAERLEVAWGRARAGLDLFDPEGRLNDRARAEAEIAAALADLSGPDWSKVRNVLTDPRCLSFLDRMHRRLEAAEPRPEWRAAMARRWWPRHHRSGPSGPANDLVRAVARGRQLSDEERVSDGRVAAVLSDTFRASSAVEWMNSVLRMNPRQARMERQPGYNQKSLTGG